MRTKSYLCKISSEMFFVCCLKLFCFPRGRYQRLVVSFFDNAVLRYITSSDRIIFARECFCPWVGSLVPLICCAADRTRLPRQLVPLLTAVLYVSVSYFLCASCVRLRLVRCNGEILGDDMEATRPYWSIPSCIGCAVRGIYNIYIYKSITQAVFSCFKGRHLPSGAKTNS